MKQDEQKKVDSVKNKEQKKISVDPELVEKIQGDFADEAGQNEGDDIDKEEDFPGIFEAVLFLSNDPLPISFFVKNFGLDQTNVKIILDSLVDEYEERDGGVKLVEISNGFQFVSNHRYAESVRKVLGFRKKEPLSKSMLETLAIVAYKQPVVLAEVEELRGVSSRMMVANLMKKNLIKPVGRKDIPGRPLAINNNCAGFLYGGSTAKKVGIIISRMPENV
jgi:segregation and condensation protein B